MTSGALDGIRVIDCATLGAAPFAAAIMAEFGAEVIKVERPGVGDPLRDWATKHNGVGLLWKSIARNKKSITLDLHYEEGRDLLRRLAEESDVLIVNFRPGRLEEWSLGWDDLHKVNPSLVMLQITGFGYTGPYASRPGFGTLGEAMSGFAHVVGEEDGPPTLPPFMLADGVAGLNAVYAVMFALYHRDVHGGGGQFVDVSLIEPLMRLLEHIYLDYDKTGRIAQRSGSRWDVSVPRNIYKTSDEQWVATSGSAPSIAERFFKALGREDLARDSEYSDAQKRLEHADEIDEMVSGWMKEHTLEEVLSTLKAAGVAIAPVYDVQQAMADPHLNARGNFVKVEDPDVGELRVLAPVPRLSETSGEIDHLGPKLGGSNDAIYAGLLGIDDDTIRDLSNQGVI